MPIKIKKYMTPSLKQLVKSDTFFPEEIKKKCSCKGYLT